MIDPLPSSDPVRPAPRPRIIARLIALMPVRSRTVLSSASWLAFAQLFQLSGALLTAFILARVLGPSLYGIFGLVAMVTMLGCSLVNLGTDQIIQRQIAIAHEREAELVWAAMTIRLLGAAVIMPLIFLSLFWTIGDQVSAATLLIVSLTIILSVGEGFNLVYFAHTRGGDMARVQIVAAVGALTLRLALVFLRANLDILLLTLLIEKLILVGYLMWRLNRQHRLPPLVRPAKGALRPLLEESWPVFLSMIAVAVYLRIDLFMIQTMLPAPQLGLYVAAARLSEAWYFVPSVVCSSLLPSLTQIHRNDVGRYHQALTLSYGIMFWVSIALSIATTILARPMLTLLFGQAYGDAAPVLAVGVWAGVFVAFGGLTRQATNVERTQSVLMWGTIAGALLNIGLNLVLLPRMGIVGAALATLISYSVPAWLCTAFSAGTRRLFVTITLAPFAVIGMAWRRIVQ